MRDKLRRKRLPIMRLLCLILLLTAPSVVWAAALSVTDDRGALVRLTQPAKRVISLAPHITEIIFAAGGGARLVGTLRFSDYPSAAQQVPRVGDSRALDLERIVALKPDLIVAWRTGNTQRQLDMLHALQIPIFYSEPRTLNEVATNLERLGVLLNTNRQAQTAAMQFRRQLETLRRQYAKRPSVRVFYQVADNPLMTLNGQHIVNDIIVLCGGHNIFANLLPLVPTISTEAVLAADPQVIIATTPRLQSAEKLPMNLTSWRHWSQLNAVANNNLFAIQSDLIDRPGPRLIKGAMQLCESLEKARQRRKKVSKGL